MDAKKTSVEFTAKDIEENKVIAAIGYLGILCLIPLLTKKDSPYAQANGKQGLVLMIGWILSWIPIVGWLLGIVLLVVMVVAIIKTLSGSMWKIPGVYDLSQKINL